VRRRSRDREPRACLTAGCGTMLPHWKLLCDACFKRLPWPRRRALLDAPVHLRFERGREAATWLAANTPAAEAARRMGERDG